MEWGRYGRGDEYGDRLEIYPERPPHHGQAAPRPASLYSFFEDGVYIQSVASWMAPEAHPRASGVLLKAHGGAGSHKRFILLASDDGRHFRVLLDVVSLFAGESRGLEMVDLDGDGYPELLTIADYSGVPHAALVSIWKWSPAQRRYVMERTCPYWERLRPPGKAATVRAQ